ncbi:hypothetical protein ACFSX5_09400 [Devosia albogilva]|uniref:Uncharacterized protein n=1 Tax=Devosia albogilva TaxID=429726 RepID=A0ABW5QKH7_9HYPH
MSRMNARPRRCSRKSLVFGLWGRDGAYQDLALVGALMAMIGALAIGFVDRERRRAG